MYWTVLTADTYLTAANGGGRALPARPTSSQPPRPGPKEHSNGYSLGLLRKLDNAGGGKIRDGVLVKSGQIAQHLQLAVLAVS